MAEENDAPGLLSLYAGRVAPGWIDFNGHMTESRYLHVFAESTDALLRLVGVDASYVAAGHSYFTVETHLFHRCEARLDEAVRSRTQILAFDPKRLHLFHRLFRDHDGRLLATGEHMLLHVDMVLSKACAVPAPVAERLSALAARHAGLPYPSDAGRVGSKSGDPKQPGSSRWSLLAGI